MRLGGPLTRLSPYPYKLRRINLLEDIVRYHNDGPTHYLFLSRQSIELYSTLTARC